MNIPYREELETYSVLIGNNTPITHPVLGAIPVKGCFPLPTTLTGTVTSDNAGSSAGLLVVGVGTLFITGGPTYKVEPNDFLADSNGVLRRVKFVMSDTMLQLEAKFPSSLSGAALKRVKKNYYRNIMAKSTGTVAATLNEQTFEPNASFVNDGAPISYDVSTANSEITFTLSI